MSLFLCLTTWALIIGTVHLYLSVKVTSDPSVSYGLLAIHHLLYTIVIVMQIVVTSVYWSLMHEGLMKKYEGKLKQQIVNGYLIHIIPQIICFSNAYMTNTVLSSKLLKIVVIGGVFFSINNCASTLMRGKPVYPILPWDSMNSVYFCIVLLIATSTLYGAMCKLDEYLKQDSLIKVVQAR